MKKIRSSGRLVSFLLAILILNVSIDIPDELIYSRFTHTNHSINEMESITEFVFEQCLHFENAFPETEGDDRDENSRTKKSSTSILLFSLIGFQPIERYELFSSVYENAARFQSRLSANVSSPPPEQTGLS